MVQTKLSTRLGVCRDLLRITANARVFLWADFIYMKGICAVYPTLNPDHSYYFRVVDKQLWKMSSPEKKNQLINLYYAVGLKKKPHNSLASTYVSSYLCSLKLLSITLMYNGYLQ